MTAITPKVPAAAGETSPTPTPASAKSYVKCSLCNNIVDDETTHIAVEHGHLKHLKEMLQVPLRPPPVAGTADAALHAVGVFAVSTSQNADRGPEAFCVMQRAQEQLHRLLDGIQDSQGCVYAFGSVVSLGCWDGVGDGDFAFIEPKWFYTPAPSGQIVTVTEDDDENESEGDEEEQKNESATDVADVDGNAAAEKSRSEGEAAHERSKKLSTTEKPRWGVNEVEEDIDFSAVMSAVTWPKLKGKTLSPEREKQIIYRITSRLRDAGFRFEELDPVLHARIPVVRRKKPTHDPLNLRTIHQGHLIRIRFERPDSEERFRRGRLHTLISTYNAREVTPADNQRNRQLVLAVPDSCDAVHLMSRRERIAGVRKEWVEHIRTPEIFAIDFDLSCRYHGIRNSWLLRRYLEQDEVFRMGSVFLKRWSKACGVNNSRIGFLTSYAVSILWVYFLLRRGAVEFVNPNDVPVLPEPAKQMTVPYMPLWPALDGDDESAAAANVARTTRLGALLCDFFYFYGEEFDWATQVVTIRQPCPTAAEVRMKADLNWLVDDTLSLLLRDHCYHIFSIEDVYEDNLDLGRHLTADKAAWTRLQFRLAYTRSTGAQTQLMRLLDEPQKRASAVLRARLFRHLLFYAESNAEATVADLIEPLCCLDEDFPGEDPEYLLSAYEMGKRLSDLWYDVDQIKLDVANHRKYDRRANLFSPPEDPTEHGKWGLLCSDPLPTDIDATEGHDKMAGRRVRLESPKTPANGPHGSGRVVAHRSPKSQREIHLIKARNLFHEIGRQFDAGAKQHQQNSRPAVVGIELPKSAKETVYPHCFYVLQQCRLFRTYDAREVFLQCLNDVAWEVTRLHEIPGDSTEVITADRGRLLKHLQEQLHSLAAVLPGYAEALHYIVMSSCDYVHFNVMDKAIKLIPSPLLLRIVGADRNAPAIAGVPQSPPTSAAEKPPAGSHRHVGPASKYKGRNERGWDGWRHGQNLGPCHQPATAAEAAPPEMNAAKKKTGTCDECSNTKIEVFPTTVPELDDGFYCAECWSRYLI